MVANLITAPIARSRPVGYESGAATASEAGDQRHCIHRDLFGRFELLDPALDEAAAEIDDDLSELPRKLSDSAARS